MSIAFPLLILYVHVRLAEGNGRVAYKPRPGTKWRRMPVYDVSESRRYR